MVIARLYTFKGKVQNVEYRHFAEKVAAKYEVSGYARHVGDNLEVYVIGDQSTLDHFEWRLINGPKRSDIDEVIMMPAEIDPAITTFFIVR